MSGETDIKTAAKKDLLKMPAKVREFACLSFSSAPNARRMHKPCHNCSSISTKSAFEQLIYIHCTTIDVKITAFTKNDLPNGIQNDSASSEISSRQTSQSCSLQDNTPFQSKAGPQYHSSLSFSPSFSFWFIFYCFSLSLHFLSLHLLFSILFQDLAFPSFWLAVIAFALSFALFSGLGRLRNGGGFRTACYRHVSFLHCKCLRTHKHYWWYFAYGFLICNRDVFTRQQRGEVSDRRELPTFH